MHSEAMMSEERSKLERIVEARMKLKARFESALERTPARSDARPRGSGPSNRHGMPKLPPGQHVTDKWPVLDLGVKPEIPTNTWRLEIDGLCAHPVSLSWDEFMALEQIEDTSDFHCVTTWSKLDVRWSGVRFRDLMALVAPSEQAHFVMCHAHDDYTTNVALVECMQPDVLLVHSVNGAPLPLEHGGPVRMVTPQLYAWKGAKWIRRIELMATNRRGFWEQRGYSNSAHPWRNDRYS